MNSLTLIAEKDTKSLEIPEEDLEKLKSNIRKGAIAQLSPDKEAVPFMFYAMGNDWESISSQTNIPKDILYATALYYDWGKKIAALRNKSSQFSAENMLSDVYDTAMIIIKYGMQEIAREVLSGEKKVSQFPLFPKNLHGFEKLFTILEKLKEFSGELNPERAAGKGNTVVQAQNVQINQTVTSDQVLSEEETEARRVEREAKYKALRGE